MLEREKKMKKMERKRSEKQIKNKLGVNKLFLYVISNLFYLF